MAMLNENVAALQQRIGAPLLGVVPHREQPDAREVATFLNLALLEQAGDGANELLRESHVKPHG